MVLDRAQVHPPEKSKLVQALVERVGPRLKLRFLSSYSPDCNPMELLWKDWRDNVIHNHDCSQIEQSEGASDRYFRRRRKDQKSVLKLMSGHIWFSTSFGQVFVPELRDAKHNGSFNIGKSSVFGKQGFTWLATARKSSITNGSFRKSVPTSGFEDNQQPISKPQNLIGFI